MIKSYIRSAFRNLLRNKLSSLINVVGLSIALASTIVVYLFLQTYYTLDTFHEHGDRIFMVEHVAKRDGAEQTWGTAPHPLGPALEADLPEVERAVRVAWMGADVRTDADSYDERIGFADPGFFEMFTFPLKAGTPASLDERGSVIISEAAARKFFGDEDPMGRHLTISFGEAGAQTFTVGGVAQAFPRNAGLRFDVLLPFESQPNGIREDDWATLVDATFLQLRRPEDIHTIAAQMEGYLTRWNAANADAPVERFAFENLKQPSAGGHNVLQRPTEAPHPAFSLVMIAIAVLMMALSCFNYVNISLGSAARRLKEIGMRKVMGGTQRQLIVQFMTENLLLCTLAMVLGVAIAWLVLVPLFNGLFVIQVALSLTESLSFWAVLVSLLVIVGVISGAYPAFYISSFQPASIFRGKRRLAEKGWFTRSLVTAQFIIVFLAVIATAVLVMNGRYLLGMEWGYENEDVVVVRLADSEQYEILSDVAARQASLIRAAGSQDHIGVSMARTTFAIGSEEEQEARSLTVGPGYLETMGIRLRSGRLFDERIRSDVAEIVVNQRFVEEQGWEEPLKRVLRVDGHEFSVVGVVEDFLYDPVSRPEPVLLRRAEGSYRFLTVRVVPGGQNGMRAALEAHWKENIPELPFESFSQDSVFDAQYSSYISMGRGIGYLAALALLIACMGVFGLASQNIARRLKEVSVRKVLGASIPHIVFLVNRAFVVILALAAAVATLLSYAALRTLISLDVANFMPVTLVPFVTAYIIVGVTVAVSVAVQSRALALANPADILRSA